MKHIVIQHLKNSRLIKHFLASPAPRWTVFLADLLTVTIACLLTFSFNAEAIGPDNGMIYSPIVKSAIILAVYCVLSWVFKTSRYIIRLSVLEDVYRIVVLILVASVTLAAGSAISWLFLPLPYLRIWNIFVIGVLSFSMMMVMRLVIKYVYHVVTDNGDPKKRVIVLGSAINSFVHAHALKTEFEGRFNPVALLSLSEKNADTTVSGIPIVTYDPARIRQIFDDYQADTLLFLSTQIDLMRSGCADVFLDNNIKLLVLNQVEEFEVNGDAMANLSTHVRNISIEDLLGRPPIVTEKKRINHILEGEVVMITGAAGSIGSEIVKQVADCGASRIVLVDQAETPMHEVQLAMKEQFPDVDMQYYIADVVNADRMEQIFRDFRPRYVFHAAAYKHVPMMEQNPVEAVMTNVFGTKNVADLSAKYGVEKFVMISTDKAVNPTNVMGASKRIAEIYVQSLFYHLRSTTDGKHTQFITTRFGNVLGSNGSVIPLFRRQIENGGPVTITHRDIIRYFMTIPEACSLVLEAGCMGNGGEIYIFDMGKPVKIYDLAVRMISLAGLRVNQDIKIVETGLRPGEKLYEELLNDKESTIATHHQKIMIAKVRTYDYNDVVDHLCRLHQTICSGSNHGIVHEMKSIVPEYVSQNSKWAEVDGQIEDNERITEIKPN